MSRMSNILLVAGLVILLCGPSVALSQTAVMQSGCARTMPQIDGQLENLWLTEAHHENITGRLLLADSALQQLCSLGKTDLYVMNDGRYLYLALVMTTEPSSSKCSMRSVSTTVTSCARAGGCGVTG